MIKKYKKRREKLKLSIKHRDQLAATINIFIALLDIFFFYTITFNDPSVWMIPDFILYHAVSRFALRPHKLS